jgi:predicted amidophosphoribosyltransferase
MLLLESLLDLAAPEACALCGARRGAVPWCAAGPPVAGLRRLDRSHLCLSCHGALAAAPPCGAVLPGGLPVFAAAATTGPLVAAVGAWKYQGLRGLGWPLAAALGPAAGALAAAVDGTPVLVPIPLHRRRRRERGFNQAAVLARLVALARGWEVADLLVRRRATGQQARLDDDALRARNLAGAFAAGGEEVRGAAGPLVLVDDIVTSGATAAAAAHALALGGRRPAAVLALGLRAGPG